MLLFEISEFQSKSLFKTLIWPKNSLNVRFRLIPLATGMVVIRLFVNEKSKKIEVFDVVLPHFHNIEFLYIKFRSMNLI